MERHFSVRRYTLWGESRTLHIEEYTVYACPVLELHLKASSQNICSKQSYLLSAAPLSQRCTWHMTQATPRQSGHGPWSWDGGSQDEHGVPTTRCCMWRWNSHPERGTKRSIQSMQPSSLNWGQIYSGRRVQLQHMTKELPPGSGY